MTEDEQRIHDIEKRVRATHTDGDEYYRIKRQDFETLLNSRLAWKFTAKCFAVDSKKNS